MLRRFMIIGCGILAAVSMPALSGCARTIQANLAGVTSAQVTTLTDAENATAVVAKGADIIVNSANIPTADLRKALDLADAVANALTVLETAEANGQSLDFAAFNAALAAFQTFEATLPKAGVVEPTTEAEPSPLVAATSN